MNDRQTIFPSVPRGVLVAFADEPVLIDGMKLEFDDKVALYPASVEVTSDPGTDTREVRRDTSTGPDATGTGGRRR